MPIIVQPYRGIHLYLLLYRRHYKKPYHQWILQHATGSYHFEGYILWGFIRWDQYAPLLRGNVQNYRQYAESYRLWKQICSKHPSYQINNPLKLHFQNRRIICNWSQSRNTETECFVESFASDSSSILQKIWILDRTEKENESGWVYPERI